MWQRQQAVETHFMPKQRHQGVTRFLQTQWLFTVTPKHQNKVPLCWGLREIFHDVMKECGTRSQKVDSNPVYSIIIYMASGKSLNLSGTAFLPQKGIMPSVLPVLQDCYNSGIRSHLCEYCANHNLQTDSMCRVYQNDVHKNCIFNCFKILKDEWGKLLLHENTNK